VVSHLPYSEIVSQETFDVTDVMMDDGRILLLKVSDIPASLDNGGSYLSTAR